MQTKKIINILIILLSTLFCLPAAANVLNVSLTKELNKHPPYSATIQINLPTNTYLYVNKFKLQGDALKSYHILPQANLNKNSATYSGNIDVQLYFNTAAFAEQPLSISYQACEQGLCTPPAQQTVLLTQLELTVDENVNGNNKFNAVMQNNAFWVSLSFIGFGLLLSFTPCSLPMVPILANLILVNPNSTKRAFILSVAYSLGIASTLAMVGFAATFLGKNLNLSVQNIWVAGAFAFLLVLLSFKQLGFIKLNLPFINSTSNHLDNKLTSLRTGGILTTFFIGVLSSLIASPCTSAPLVGIITYVSATHNLYLGTIGLLSLGLGMSLPLIILSTLGIKFLPNTGNWMYRVNQFFALLLLVLAAEIILPFIAPNFTPSEIVYTSTKFVKQKLHNLTINISEYTQKINNTENGTENGTKKGVENAAAIAERSITVYGINNLNDLKMHLNKANQLNKKVILIVTAEWCQSCRHMERQLSKYMHDDQFYNLISKTYVLELNVTKPTIAKQQLCQELGVHGVPFMLFFTKKTLDEHQHSKLIGSNTAKLPLLLKWLNHE